MSPKETHTAAEHQFQLKPLSKDGIEAALSKAEHYRLLNQPRLAESICRDILDTEPANQKAIIILLLSLSDQFGTSNAMASREAMELTVQVKDEYARIYYTGIIHERQGNSSLVSGVPGADFDAYEWFREAMDFYDKAAAMSPKGNNDAVLRWNTCARIIMQSNLRERPDDNSFTTLE